MSNRCVHFSLWPQAHFVSPSGLKCPYSDSRVHGWLGAIGKFSQYHTTFITLKIPLAYQRYHAAFHFKFLRTYDSLASTSIQYGDTAGIVK